jgi:integrase
MPRPKSLIPAYRHHKARNLAVVRINGKDRYLGPFGSPESLEKYHQLTAEQHARLNSAPPPPAHEFLGVNCVIEQYLVFARGYYQRDGEPTQELRDVTYAVEQLSELFGLANAREFGPRGLKLLQQHMIAKEWSRGVINQRINRIRRMFKWAVAEELVPPSVLHGLQAVSGLRYGRTTARETEPVKPVEDWVIEATLPFLSPPVAAMVRIQRHTAARPCEVVTMRACDIDRDGEIWIYEPATHKNQWRGHRRSIPLGPKVQEILKPFLDRPADACLFSPAEAEDHRNAERRRKRKSPITPSQAARIRRTNPKRPKRDQYDRDSYRRAIEYGVKRANKERKEGGREVPNWCPLQLRHTRATEVRRLYNLPGSQAVLGHKRCDVTQVYAERDLELALRIAKETG